MTDLQKSSSSKKFWILAGVTALLVAMVLIFRYTSVGIWATWNISQEGTWLFPLIIISALIDSINPCAFSILLLTIAFLFSLGQLRNRIFAIGGFYIIGIFIAYFLIGLGLFQALHLFNTPHFIGKIGAGLMLVLAAVNLVNYFAPRFSIKLRLPSVSHQTISVLIEKGSLPAAVVLGILVGLCEFPCTGGPYLMAVGLLHDRATYVDGIFYLLLYNVIFILPLVLMLLLASNRQTLEKVQVWHKSEKKTFRLVMGVAMLLIGLFILFF